MAKASAGKVALEVGAVTAAVAAGYYLYGSKNAKKHRDVITKELKRDWKMIQKEAKLVQKQDLPRAQAVAKKVVARGAKVVKKVVKQVKAAARKSR